MIDKRQPPLPPETVNDEQEDEAAQAQDVAGQPLGRDSTGLGLSETEKVSTGDESDDVQDLVDHMEQMKSSGTIDMSAYRGERNDDDEEGLLGEQGEED